MRVGSTVKLNPTCYKHSHGLKSRKKYKILNIKDCEYQKTCGCKNCVGYVDVGESGLTCYGYGRDYALVLYYDLDNILGI